jgi:Domain of unknown function (DUF6484)
VKSTFLKLHPLRQRMIAENYLAVGRIVGIVADGRALVDFPGNDQGSVVARSTIRDLPQSLDLTTNSLSVLLFFEGGDPSSPVIIGIVCDTLSANPDEQTVCAPQRAETILDGKRLILDAQEEIVLNCGKSSVTLRKDGKIIIKGTDIVSRASGANKLRGATVQIN